MSSVLIYLLIPAAVLGVAAVLGLGLLNMAKGGDPARSQKLMQQRVMLQAVAIALVMAAIWLAAR